MRAGIEAGYVASGGSLVAMVLARMPLTRQAGRFRGARGVGRGGTTVRRSDLATMLSTEALGTPGSSSARRSYLFTAFWICRLACLAVRGAVDFFGKSKERGADVAAAAAYEAGSSRPGVPERSRRDDVATVRRSRRRPRCPWYWAR